MNDNFHKITACYGRLYHFHELRSARSNGPFTPDNGGFRLRQRGTLFTFCTKNSQREFFVQKIAGGDIPRQTRDRLMHVSLGRFAVFAHVVVFVVQAPTA